MQNGSQVRALAYSSPPPGPASGLKAVADFCFAHDDNGFSGLLGFAGL
ncbi:MAG: hypothetical protein RL215_1986 [Planctomycetota bacterium]